jgi:Ca-activated chloride channel family protein
VLRTRQYITYSAVAGLCAFGWICYLCSIPARAQEPRVAIEPRAIPVPGGKADANRLDSTFRVNSDLVLIPVMVTDRNNRAVTGLEREHFRLWENKVEQTITHFATEDVGISVVLAFDVSGSMGNKLKVARAAVNQFLKTANPADEFSLVAFSDQAQVIQKFTTEGDEIQNRMLFLQPRGRTALLDAVVLSLNEMKNAKHARKALLIVSDGGDNSSRYSIREVKERVREADVQIYSIGIEESLLRPRSMEELGGAALLNDIAAQSGGRLYEINDPNELPDVATKIGMALHTQYVLGYVPSSAGHDGKYHRVQVKVSRPPGVPPLRASFRAGYIAPGN